MIRLVFEVFVYIAVDQVKRGVLTLFVRHHAIKITIIIIFFHFDCFVGPLRYTAAFVLYI